MDLFCDIINGEKESICLFEDDTIKCIMDAFPNSPGHTLILPKKHFTDIMEIDDATLVYIFKRSRIIIDKMMSTLPNITGVRVLVNYGEPQAIKHFHLHLIPTYSKNLDKTQKEICEMLK